MAMELQHWIFLLSIIINIIIFFYFVNGVMELGAKPIKQFFILFGVYCINWFLGLLAYMAEIQTGGLNYTFFNISWLFESLLLPVLMILLIILVWFDWKSTLTPNRAAGGIDYSYGPSRL